ncbi:AT-hook motif nuclear-localized protein 17 [Glycine soja]
MTNNSMAISTSQNSVSFDLDLTSSWLNHTSSSSQCPRCPPSPATNQPLENLPLTNPPTKKPHGRPAGSKNKPKITPFQVAQPVEPCMKVIIVNVTPSSDIIESILDVAHQGHVSLTVLSASGMITGVTLNNSSHGVDALTLRGPFTLLSLNGSYLYNNHYALHPGATPAPPLSFGISFSTSQGQVFGGAIGGRVIADNDVSLTICTFKNPVMYKHASRDKERDRGDNDNNNNYNNNYSF